MYMNNAYFQDSTSDLISEEPREDLIGKPPILSKKWSTNSEKFGNHQDKFLELYDYTILVYEVKIIFWRYL